MQDNEDQEQLSPLKTPTSACPPVSYGSTSDAPTRQRPSSWTPEDPSEATNSTTASSGKKRSLVADGKPETPRRKFLLDVFFFIEGFGVVTSLCLMTTQIIPMILIPIHDLGVFSFILKIYVSLFCLLFLLLEWDISIVFLRNATFLQNYFSRGFLYSFMGLSCLEEAYSERVKDMVAHAKEEFHVSWVSLFMQVSSWMMLGLGILYMIMGLCCLKLLRDKLKLSHQQSWSEYREQMKIYRANHPE